MWNVSSAYSGNGDYLFVFVWLSWNLGFHVVSCREEIVDQKKVFEDSCKSKCTKPFVDYQVIDEMFWSSYISSLNNLFLTIFLCYLSRKFIPFARIIEQRFANTLYYTVLTYL